NAARNSIRIQRRADVNPYQERRTIEGSARLRIGSQYRRAVVGAKPEIGRGNEQTIITRCPTGAAAGQEGINVMVSRAADRDLVSTRGQTLVDPRAARLVRAIGLPNHCVAKRVIGVTRVVWIAVIQAEGSHG